MSKPNCYTCIHRRNVPGSAHSSCHHPAAEKMSVALGVLATLAAVRRVDLALPEAAEELNITAHQHGIDNGWFVWPWNFDPVWLKTCKGFQQKEQEQTE
jgi:hypothetical protein